MSPFSRSGKEKQTTVARILRLSVSDGRNRRFSLCSSRSSSTLVKGRACLSSLAFNFYLLNHTFLSLASLSPLRHSLLRSPF